MTRARHPIVRILLALLLLIPPAGNAKPEDRPAHIDELEREVRRLRSLEQKYRSVERNLANDIESLTRDLALADSELALAAARLARGQTDLDALNTRIAEGESRLEGEAARLAGALVATYRGGVSRSHQGSDLLRVLLTSDSASDLPRNLRMLAAVSGSQAAALEGYRLATADLRTSRQKLLVQNAQLASLGAEVAGRQAVVAAARERKERFLQEVSGRRGEAMTALRVASRELAGFVNGLEGGLPQPAPSSGFADHRGLLPWPAAAPVSKGFGIERHPRFHTLVEHSGLEFAAAIGTPVHAVHAGQVAYADWFKGYGNLVIVAHGDGFYTLYARLDTVLLARGARVSAGTLVGRSGATGSLDGPSLYFEIRQGDKALDPARWLRQR